MATAAEAGAICRNHVNGEWIESKSQKIVERRNPANTDELVARVALSTGEEAKDAIGAAKAALSAWRATPAPVRGSILFKAARLMDEQKTELARLLTREEGKALKDALGEVQRSINIMEFMAGEARRLTGETLPSELPKNFSYTIRQPVGVVGVITPWNFPLAIPVWKIAPALVCGNTVVFKPATLTPLCAMRLVQVLEQAGLPAGVLNLVTGSGKEVGDEIVTNPNVQAVSFTGSNSVGGDLYATGASESKKVQCEMGGKNPVVILRDADLHLAMESALFGAFASTGQRCTATSRVIVEESVADEWVEMLAKRAGNFVVGDGLDPAVDMGPLVDEGQMNAVVRYIEIGKKEAELKCGGERLSGSKYDKGWFVAPTLFDHVPPESVIAQEEIFGPVLSVIRVKNFDEAVAAANSVRYGLTSSVYTADANKIFEFVERSEAGMVHVNSPTVGGEAHVPFGGTKSTSVGPKEVGRSALDFYSEIKIVYVDYTGRKRESSIY
ncbi:MAG: aldehyde dehydrogenase family protein [Candidatus Acidiferrales bacterium]